MPPPYVDFSRNLMLNSLGASATFASIHTADPGSGGTSEVSGGSPAYARKAITWSAASGGAMVASTNPVFDIPAGTTIKFAGFWTAVTSGTYLGSGPLGGGALVGFLTPISDLATELIEAPAHGFTDGNQVVVSQLAGRAVPTGITAGNNYYVVNSTTDTLQLATTLGGSAINITAIGEGFLQRIIPEAFAGQGTYTLTSAQLNLLAA